MNQTGNPPPSPSAPTLAPSQDSAPFPPVAALVTFITSWSIFAGHRILAYELPLMGASFFRVRVLSVVALPFLAGVFAMLVGLFVSYGTPAIIH